MLDLGRKKVLQATRLQAPINHVELNPRHPSVLLVTQAGREGNIVVLDHRSSYNRPVLSYGYPLAGGGPTSAVKAHWSPTGLQLACGGVDAAAYLWDVRRQGSPLWAPHQEFRGIHEGRLFDVAWHPKASSTLVTIALDRAIGIHAFRVAPV